MKLNQDQSRELLRKHGIYLTEACYKCGKLLAPIRFTRKGETGVWCSRECRDGVERLAEKRKGGRPRLYKTNAHRQRAYRKRHAMERYETSKLCVQNQGVADAILDSGYGGSRKPNSGLEIGRN